MRLFRMKYIVPRLILCLLAVVFLALASRPIIRSIVLQSVQSMLGAQARVKHVRTSLKDARVQLIDFSAADFHNPDKTLFRAAAIDLELDRELLLRRKCVVRRGRVIGLELVADHENRPANSIQPRQTEKTNSFGAISGRWLEKVANELSSEMQVETSSVALSNDLARWPDETNSIESKAHELTTRVMAVRDMLDRSGTNPLRNMASLAQAIGELESLDHEIFEVRRQVEDIRQQMEMDRDTVAKARQQNIAKLQESDPLEALDEAALSQYLLNADVTAQMDTVMHWLQLSRRYSPTLLASHSLRRHRGKSFLLPGMQASPAVQLETLVLQGTGTFGAQPVNIEGTIRNLSSDPQALGKPTEFTIQTTGHLSLLVQGTLDATGKTLRNEFVIDCPSTPQDRKLLGDPEQFSIVVSPSPRHVWAKVSIVGDALHGEVLMKQASPALTPQLHPELGSGELAQALDATLSSIESIDVSVQVSGSLASPIWSLRSNLGPHVARGMRSAVESCVAARREQRILQVHAKLDEQLRGMEQELMAKQQAILQSLQAGSEEIERTRQDIASRVEGSDLSGQSPLR